MIIKLFELNWLSILAAFAAYFFLGALWFTFLFKKQYLASLGRENQEQQDLSPIYIAGPAICSFIITVVTALLMYILKIDSLKTTLEFALVIGLGYLVANTVNIAINPNMPKPLYYGAISGLYHLVGILLVCMIIFIMN